MWQGICTFLCTFYACMTSFLNLFSAVRQCLLAVPPDRRTPFSLFYSPFSRITCSSHKNICLPSRSCLPIILPYRYILQLHLRNILFPPSAIFHRAIHIALCSQCTACRFLSIVPDTFLPDPPASPPRCTFLPLFSALLYNFPLLLYCHAGTYTT